MDANRWVTGLARATRVARGISGLLGFLGLLGALGCDPAGGAPVGDSAGGTTIPPVDTVVPQPVQWEPEVLDSTLRTVGLESVPIARGRDPFTKVPAAAYRIGEATVRTYFFADPVGAARGMSRVVRRGDTTTVFTSNNMLVVVRAKDAALRQRIRRTLTDPEIEGMLSR